MELDTLKTSAGDNGMDMLAMMMHMEKLPEFCDSIYNIPTYLDKEFSGGNHSTGIACGTQPILPSQCIASPLAFMASPPSTAVFMSNPIHEPVTPPLQSNAVSGRLKNPNTAYPYSSTSDKAKSMAVMREMIFRMAVMQPIHIDSESIKPPKRKNVKISTDPQSVAARHRRERISERIRILQKLVPGGTKMDTASMLDEAIHYVKFLKKQVQTLEQAGVHRPMGVLLPGMMNINVNHSALLKGDQPSQAVDPIHMLRSGD